MVEAPNVGVLEQVCRKLVAATGLSWEWEDRFGVMLAVVKGDQLRDVESKLSDAFDSQFGGREDLPETPKQIADRLGGLRAGQQLFTTEPGATVVVYCAWWPWGGGSTVSLRVGQWSALPNEVLESAFPQWFS